MDHRRPTPSVHRLLLRAPAARLDAHGSPRISPGEGAVRRHVIRMAIPPLLVLAPLWLLPASLYVHLEMTAPIYIWAMLMSLALNKIWRRHRLAQHGLDPNLVDVIRRKRDSQLHEDYARRFGPRPESARFQANSSPF